MGRIATVNLASLHLRAHNLSVQMENWRSRHRLTVRGLAFLAVSAFAVVTTVGTGFLAGDYFQNEKQLASLQELLINVGAALIGAAAIAFSQVLFAMQVNVGRMPHGLFRNLSSDRRLIGAFVSSVVLGLGVCGLSLAANQHWAALLFSAGFWAVISVLTLFIYAYRRALTLIRPVEQLGITKNGVREHFRLKRICSLTP